MIDKSAESAEDPNYLLTLDDVKRVGDTSTARCPQGGWLFLRTGWDARAHDQDAFLNGGETPGPDVECARWLAEEAPIVGFGVETVGTDAGAAHSFDPPFPVHNFLLGAGKYGLTQLANLAELPPTGAVVDRRAAEAGATARARPSRVLAPRCEPARAARRDRSRCSAQPAERAAVALVEQLEHALHRTPARGRWRVVRRCPRGPARRSARRAAAP